MSTSWKEWEMDRVASEPLKYLETECGYRRTRADVNQVTFETADVFIELVIDPRAYEVSIVFGPADEKDWAYGFADLARALPQFPSVRHRAIVRTPTDLVAFVERVGSEARDILCSLPHLSRAVFDEMKAGQREAAARREVLGARARHALVPGLNDVLRRFADAI